MRYRDPEKRRKETKKYREKNKENIRIAQEKYRAIAENREENKVRSKTWRTANPERATELGRASYLRNRTVLLQRSVIKHKETYVGEGRIRKLQSNAKSRAAHPQTVKDWHKKNPQKRRVYNGIREARKKGLPTYWNTEHWSFALEYFHHCCAVCGTALQGFFHVGAADHWISLVSPQCPGTIPGNMVPLCHGLMSCNLSKHDTDPTEWLVRRYGERKSKTILKRINTFFAVMRERFPLPGEREVESQANDDAVDDEVPLQSALPH